MPTQQSGYATQDEAYNALIKAGATQQVAQVLAAVSRPESSGQTYAVNNYQGNQYLGLWQIGNFHGFDNQRLLSDDIQYQAAAALQVYKQQGFGAWETYTNGAYQKYLNQNSPALGDLSNPQTLAAAGGGLVNPNLDYSAAGAQAAGHTLDNFQRLALGLPIDPSNPQYQGPVPFGASNSAAGSPQGNALDAPDTGATAIDQPGASSPLAANPIDAPGTQTALNNPIAGPQGFDQSQTPGG